jgi:uncharacterized protein (TIGR03000 family)
MWRNRIMALAIVVGALSLTPSKAQAQFFGGFGFNPVFGRGFFPYYGGWPYGGYGYSPYMSNPYMYNPFMYNSFYMDPFYRSGPVIYPGFAAVGDVPRMRSSLYPAVAVIPASFQAPDNRAHIRVLVPAGDAQIWLDNMLMKETGSDRQFVTPALAAKSTYSYQVRARWRDQNGTLRTDTRNIHFQAGGNVTVDFTRPR